MKTPDDVNASALDRDAEARKLLALIDRALVLATDAELRDRLEWSAGLIRIELLPGDGTVPRARSTPRD